MGEIFSSWTPLQTGLALLVGGAFAVMAIKLIWGASQWGRKTPHRVGSQMTGARASVTEWSGGEGLVLADGENWRAKGPASLAPGDDVKIVRVDGLTLEVRKKTSATRKAGAVTKENAMPGGLGILIGLGMLVFVILTNVIKILKEYEKGVVFTLGRVGRKAVGPGLILLIPIIQEMRKIDMRTLVHDVPTQDVISKDNVSVKVNAVIYYRVVDAVRAVVQVENYMAATSQLAQTTLRSVLGKHDLDEMLQERDKLNKDVQSILDIQTEAWGIKVSNVEIKHVDVDPTMIRAIAKQAEAERERRAKVILAQGEEQAATKLAEAATILATQPGSMELRYLNALQEIAGDRTNTIVFPFSMAEVSKAVRGDKY